MVEVDAPAAPAAAPRPNPGSGGPMLELRAPMYARKVPPPPAPPQSFRAPPRDSRPPQSRDGPPGASRMGGGSGGPPSSDSDDGPSRDNARPQRRQKEKPGAGVFGAARPNAGELRQPRKAFN